MSMHVCVGLFVRFPCKFWGEYADGYMYYHDVIVCSPDFHILYIDNVSRLQSGIRPKPLRSDISYSVPSFMRLRIQNVNPATQGFWF